MDRQRREIAESNKRLSAPTGRMVTDLEDVSVKVCQWDW